MIRQAFLSVVHPTEWDTLHLKNVPIVLQGTYRYSIIAFIPASLAPSTKGNAHDKRRPTPVERLSIRTYTLIFMGLSPPHKTLKVPILFLMVFRKEASLSGHAIINVKNDGNSAINSNTITNPIKKGSSPLVTSPMDSFDMEHAEKIFTATGGVIAPITPARHTIRPNSIAVSPMDIATGHKTGTNNTQIAVPSRKVPKKRSKTAISTQNSLGLMFRATIPDTMASDMSE